MGRIEREVCRDREEYNLFLMKLFSELNAGRRERFDEELKALPRLPPAPLDSCKRFRVKVGPSSTIRVSSNVYSVDSRLIDEVIYIRSYADYFEIWYGQRRLEVIPRLRGSRNHHIQCRHINDGLVRKTGAFENYRYKKNLFPTHRFRMAYDYLKKKVPHKSIKEYLKILHLAAKESELAVDKALNQLIEQGVAIYFEGVLSLIKSKEENRINRNIKIRKIDLSLYDQLLPGRMVV